MQVEMEAHTATKNSITRIVTTYGHWHYIRRWIFDEKLIQPHMAWIFLNDKPDDPAPEDIKRRIAQIGLLIENKANMGRCCARNLGIWLAKSEWIDVVDGDDFPLPVREDFCEQKGSFDLIFFDVVHHRENNGEIISEADEGWQPPLLNQLLQDLTGNVDPRPASTLWRRKTILELGGFDGRADYVEDFNLAVRAKIAKVKTTNTHLVKASYQRGTANRSAASIIPVSCLTTYELARKVVSEPYVEALEEQIKFYRQALLWQGMIEMKKSNPSVFTKLKECGKWLFNRV
jgi:glycosyltransferase involved in cell wall biosynthesis